jgi:hypothetical protein
MLTSRLESPSHLIMRFISLASRMVCMRLCLRGKASKRAPQTFCAHNCWETVLASKDCDGVRELRPKMNKTPIHCVFEKVTFMCVQIHPRGLLGVVDGEVISCDECKAECTVNRGSKSNGIECRGPGKGPRCGEEHPRGT